MKKSELRQLIKEEISKVLKEETQYTEIQIDGEEFYTDQQGNVSIALSIPYRSNRQFRYNTPRAEYIDKHNWSQKLDPNSVIMKIINNIPNAKYDFIEYSGGDKELKVKVNIEDLKKYQQKGNYVLDI